MATPAKSKLIVSCSLAYRKFILRHEAELGSYWFQQTAASYAARWIGEHRAEITPRLTSFPGDNCTPFKNIDVSADKFLNQAKLQAVTAGHAAVSRLVTVFENFLYDCIQRAVYINPSVILGPDGKSDIKVDASELCGVISGQSARAWFAHYVADKYCRGRTPEGLIARVDALLQAGITKRLKDQIAEWVQWTLVRNAVVHLGGDVTSELADKWPERFPVARVRIDISYLDVQRVAFLSREICRQLDLGQVPMAARGADRDLLAAELFVQHGVDDPSTLSVILHSFLSVRANRGESERLIAKFRKWNSHDEGVVITDEMFDAAIAASSNVSRRKL